MLGKANIFKYLNQIFISNNAKNAFLFIKKYLKNHNFRLKIGFLLSKNLNFATNYFY